MNRPILTSLRHGTDATRAPAVVAPAASRFPEWPERARQLLLRFALNPVIGVACPAGPWNGSDFRNQLHTIIFWPWQSYRGHNFDGGEKPKILPLHIAAERSLFRDLSCFLHPLWYGCKGGKVRFNADFAVLIEPFHYDTCAHLLTTALPSPNDIGPALWRAVKDSLDDAFLAVGDDDALADFDHSDFSSCSPAVRDGQAQVVAPASPSVTHTNISDAALDSFYLGPAPRPLPSLSRAQASAACPSTQVPE
eukprot:5530638-Pleurochrysis_carterae.AAC.1